MTFKFRHLEKIVGFFMIVGILFLLVAVIFMGREQKWFEQTVNLRTVFNDGENLSKGMAVKINGLTVGKVSHVGFASNNQIDVHFSVYSDFRDKVHLDSYVFREAASPLGGGHLALTIGSADVRRATNGDILFSEDHSSVQDLIAKGQIVKKGSLDGIMKNVNLLLSQLASPQGPLIGTLNNLQTLSSKLAGGEGSVGALLNDPRLFQELLATLESVRKITEDMSIISGTLRTSSPNIRNIITGAERGLNETTRVLVGLQRYFMLQSDRTTTGTANAGPLTTIRSDRRQDQY
ncbi:MAG TPA: MlaD family protein [Spirochaetota bacterium]|nr:MlaD family protein [Spirochaetota bacterium]HPN82814.1 MlaD family protein [Spirochaetota bacterium]